MHKKSGKIHISRWSSSCWNNKRWMTIFIRSVPNFVPSDGRYDETGQCLNTSDQNALMHVHLYREVSQRPLYWTHEQVTMWTTIEAVLGVTVFMFGRLDETGGIGSESSRKVAFYKWQVWYEKREKRFSDFQACFISMPPAHVPWT